MNIKYLVLSLFAAAVAASAATITWIPSPVEEEVQTYYLEHRAVDQTEWVRVEVPATQSRVSIPEAAYGRWFRMAAANSFGVSEWTKPVKVPEKIRGVSLVVEITP